MYTLNVAGVTRQLRKVRISDDLQIASFVMLGDTELVEAAAETLYKRLSDKKIDMLVCPEAKGIPLTHAIARRLDVNYVVVRKSVKGYMENPIVEEVQSITTVEKQRIVLDGVDAERLRGQRVCIIDDVVSTGGSLLSLEKLLSRVDCQVVCKAAVLLEDGGYDGHDLVYLEGLPTFRS